MAVELAAAPDRRSLRSPTAGERPKSLESPTVMDPEIREANESELLAIEDLLVEAYSDFAPGLGTAAWARMRSSLQAAPREVGFDRWLVVPGATSLQGAVAYFPPGRGSAELFEPAWASVRLLGVRSSARRLGIGKALTLACIERANRDGARHIGLHTSELMTGAQALYEALGFRRFREIDRRFGVRYWVYARELEGVASSPAV